MRFFAVGTNMDAEHLRSWIPSARRLTIASVSGFTVRWHKRSSEGGKLAALRTGHPDDVMRGVVYEVDDLGWQHLSADQVELEITRVVDAPGVTHLHYRVR